MDIKLKEVTIENFRDVTKIQIEKDQERYVPSSCFLIAESKFHPNHQARAIYFEDTVVGLVLFQTGEGDFEPHECGIFGFMIDKRYQNKGIGKVALQLLLKEIEAIGQFTWIELSCDPENEQANSVYRKNGMLPTHWKDNGDIVFSIEKQIE